MLSYTVYVWKQPFFFYSCHQLHPQKSQTQLRWSKPPSGPPFLSALHVERGWSAFRQPMQGQNECPSKCVTLPSVPFFPGHPTPAVPVLGRRQFFWTSYPFPE